MNFYQDVFFRAMDWARGRRTIERLHFLRRSQYWDAATLERWQLDRLNELLLHAREHSPYYAQALAGLKLPFESLSQLASVPILDKPTIRANFDGLQCRGVPRSRFVMSRTGGSTGEPTIYFWDKRGMDWNRGTVYRSAEWAGVALGERTVQMSGSHFDYTQSQKLQNRIVYFLQRYRDFPVGALTEDLLEHYFEELNRFRPTSIWGYASGVSAFAEFVARKHPGAKLDFVKAIITSSETLQAQQRECINRVFGPGVVHDNYGSREMYIGAECSQHNGYHLHSEVLIVEVLNEQNQPCKPGELGRLVLTDLSNQAFPFIRYEIGDIGVMADNTPCPCGVKLPRLQRVEGRIADLIVLRDRVLTPPNCTLVFSDLGGVDAYQVRQDSLDQLDLYLVPGAGYGDKIRQYVLSSFRELAGPDVRIELHEVPAIAVPESGKRRYIVSTVSAAHLRGEPVEEARA